MTIVALSIDQQVIQVLAGIATNTLPNNQSCLIRIFFYLNGFSRNDAALKVVAGSHLYRDGDIGKSVAPTGSDEELIKNWLQDKTHPYSGHHLCDHVLTSIKKLLPIGWITLFLTEVSLDLIGLMTKPPAKSR